MMTDGAFDALVGGLEVEGWNHQLAQRIIVEARRAREAEAALKADISVMEKVFADYTSIELPDLGVDALDLCRRQGHADGLRHAAKIADAVRLEAAARLLKMRDDGDQMYDGDAAYHGARGACADEIARRIEAETPPAVKAEDVAA